ncbi:hypothetical protein [Ohtaekwangia koreensis]|uniref:Uncharacterized protein n=1 Tax=Ohtaekwangia koreensis TaxID=688867 RepID=A0A1T5JPX1_9BACT|nr:hypothetical protein [Ohtaekwangia koreensis]SKC53450.1 hypothetical protein SAMN05660236_1344 [Ohtaekwangia koreensis]
MAYGLKYFSKIRDLDDKIFTINLKQDSYSGQVYEIEKYPINPLSLTYRASSKEDDLSVHGSEVNFTFYSDGTNYDDLFTSEIRDWKVEVTQQQQTVISESIDLTTFDLNGSGQDWVDDAPYIKSDITVFLGSPTPTKRAYYPLVLSSGSTVDVDVKFTYDQTSFSNTWSVTYTVGLMNAALNTIINSKSIVASYPTTASTATVTLTATTQNAAYIYVHALVDYVSTSTNTGTVRCELLVPSTQEFEEILYWSGWLQPDNLTRKFVNPAYYINLNATDGLAELKDIPYPVEAITGTTGETTVPQIEILKTILSQTGLELDILSQVNYRTNTVSGSDSLFSNVYANQNRYVKNERNGKRTYLNCYDALSYILEAYNARISQVENKWSIIQKFEIFTPLTTFNWNDLSYTRENRDRTINIDSYRSKFDSDELSKIRPIKQINLTFFNKNVGESVVPNGNFLAGISGWNNTPFGTGEYELFEWSSGNTSLYTKVDTSYSYDPSYGRFIVESDPITLEALSTGSTLNVSFDFNLFNYSHDLPSWQGQRYVYAWLKSGSTVIASSTATANPYYYSSESQFTFTTSLPFSVTGDYTLALLITLENNGWNSAEIYWDNITAVQEYPQTITYDKYYNAIAAGQQFGIQEVDKELYFSQGIQQNDVGNLKYNPTGLTTTWSNNDSSVLNESHQHLYAYEKLKFSRFFKNYLKITLKAGTEINFNSVIEFDGKNYMISGYTYNIQMKDLSIQLIELLTDDFTLNFTQKTLLSVDGEVG